MTTREDDDLVIRYLEGAASDAEVERLEGLLRADPAARREFARLAHVQALLIDLPRPALAPIPILVRWWKPAVLAAAAVLLAIGIPWRSHRPEAAEPAIASLDGAVACERGGTQVALHAGDRLAAGDRLTLAAEAALTLAWTDGATARIAADSVIALGGHGDATIHLERGLVHAVITHRPGMTPAPSTGHPADRFRIATPDGLVEDIGTEFSVRSASDGTTIEVDEGLVVLSNPSGRVEVPAGASARCTHGMPPRLDGADTAAAPVQQPPVPAGDAPLTVTGVVTAVDGKRSSFILTDDASAVASEYRAFYAGGHPQAVLARIAIMHVGDRLTVTYVEREGRRAIRLEPATGK